MKEISDMKPLNAEQMKAVKDLLLMSQKFADNVKEIMIHSKLWHKGFALKLHVIPTMEIFTEDIQMYRKVEDGDGLYDEEIERLRGSGEDDNGWETYPTCTSREFIHLFDAEEDAAGEDAGENCETALPSDNCNCCCSIDPTALGSGHEIDSGNGYTYN